MSLLASPLDTGLAHLRDVRLQVLLKMDLTAGHAHSSDRYRYLRELAFEYAFLLEKLQTREPGAVEATSVQSTA